MPEQWSLGEPRAVILTGSRVPQDSGVQGRLVRLLCVFLTSLLRRSAGDLTNLGPELQAFCVQFSRIRRACPLIPATRAATGHAAVLLAVRQPCSQSSCAGLYSDNLRMNSQLDVCFCEFIWFAVCCQRRTTRPWQRYIDTGCVTQGGRSPVPHAQGAGGGRPHGFLKPCDDKYAAPSHSQIHMTQRYRSRYRKSIAFC